MPDQQPGLGSQKPKSLRIQRDGTYLYDGHIFSGEFQGQYYDRGAHKGKFDPESASRYTSMGVERYHGKFYQHSRPFTGEYYGQYYSEGIHKGRFRYKPASPAQTSPKPLKKDGTGRWLLHGKLFTGESAGKYFDRGYYQGRMKQKPQSGSNSYDPIKFISYPASAPCNLVITGSDFRKLQAGYSPEMMEDRWAIDFEQPNSLSDGRGAIRVCRSWTGEEHLRGEFVLLNTEWPPSRKGAHVATFKEIKWESQGLVDEDKDPIQEFIRFANNLLKTNLKE